MEMQEFLSSLSEWPKSTQLLQVYYSNFVLNSHTIDRHSHKVAFWENVFSTCLDSKVLSDSQFMFDSSILEQKFHFQNLRPLGFNSLLKYWKEKEIVVSYSDFFSSKSWTSAFLRFIWKNYDSSQEIQREKFLFMPLLNSTIQKYYIKLNDDPMDLKELQDMFNLNELDSSILVEFWNQKGLILTEKLNHTTIIKRKSGNNCINVVDHGIISIKNTLKNLKTQIQEMEDKTSKLKLEIKDFLSKGKKGYAIQTLKHVKVVESLLSKRYESLSSLETVLLKIGQVKMDQEVVEAYKHGSTTLETVLRDSGLTVDSVQDTLDKLSDTLADVKEVEDVLQDFNRDLESVDMEEIEKELDELMLQDMPSTALLKTAELEETTKSQEGIATTKSQESKETTKKEALLA